MIQHRCVDGSRIVAARPTWILTAGNRSGSIGPHAAARKRDLAGRHDRPRLGATCLRQRIVDDARVTAITTGALHGTTPVD